MVTMVMASVLSKLSGYFSFAQWLICNRLVRFLHPTDEELRTLGGVPRAKAKGKRGRDRIIEEKNHFLVPRNIEMDLDSAVIRRFDMMQLRYFPEYQWLIDFAACSMFVYVVTELYYYFFQGKDEVNLSLLWCLLVIGFTVKVLFSLTILYFRGEEPVGERSMCLTSGLFFFVAAMVVLIADENMLEFGLENAYQSFNASAHHFLLGQGVTSSGPTSKLMFKLSLAVWCGLVGAFFTFPGLRFARMHYDCLKYSSDSHFFKALLHLSFLSPLLVVLMWVKPVARDYLTKKTWPGMDGSIMRSDMFETTRLVVIVAVILFRFALMPSYLQSYLNMAPGKLMKLRREAGNISNIELQKTVARVFYYLCVVALQYITPLLLCLYTVFLLKTLGEYSWIPSSSSISNETTFAETVVSSAENYQQNILGDSLLETTQSFSLAFANLKKVFTPVLYRGVLGFMTWWLCTVWFSTSAMGLVYCSYFSDS